jgi:hypothetical protein
MKILITENKLEKVVQNEINYQLDYLKKLKEENEDNIPDNISDGTWEDIHVVEKIKVEDSRVSEFKITPEKVYIFTLGFVYDSVTGIAVDDILYDIQGLCRESLGLNIHFNLGEVINRYNEYGQW